MSIQISRRGALRLAAAGIAAQTAWGGAAHATNFPVRPIELIVPFQPGGGTDGVARAFSDAARRHMPQSVMVLNKPGASGAIGWIDMINSKPDGYKLAVVTVELVTLKPMGLAKFGYDDVQPIIQFNADPAAITVRADAPWNTVEEFLAAAKKEPGKIGMGNGSNGGIWHFAAAALGQKTGIEFNHIPYPGAGPAVLALLGGHVDAVSVSPAEVAQQLQAGKLKMLAVMADQRLKNFDKVPTLKEKGIDLSIGTWRGIAGPKKMPAEVLAYLKTAATKIVDESAFRAVLDKQNLGFVYADDQGFRERMVKDSVLFNDLVQSLNLKNN
ncbi:tripartite tricarboxylate transporter substrate binding protein [Pantoea sp. 18069]|uniref:Bug family tripartite tricarboxylate transporter substrate binding protein n=1 Tax=Pantoea sp. 18069 TaxID=2681415 RepID=UPI00135C01B5|nr:tripartite tricarboxylate transporter substrate binding protein [Pantoea sp. 18069]